MGRAGTEIEFAIDCSVYLIHFVENRHSSNTDQHIQFLRTVIVTAIVDTRATIEVAYASTF
jgi:hypothetical protein